MLVEKLKIPVRVQKVIGPKLMLAYTVQPRYNAVVGVPDRHRVMDGTALYRVTPHMGTVNIKWVRLVFLNILYRRFRTKTECLTTVAYSPLLGWLGVYINAKVEH